MKAESSPDLDDLLEQAPRSVLGEVLPHILYTADRSWDRLVLNRRFYEYTGLDQAQPGRPALLSAVYPDDRQLLIERWGWRQPETPPEIEYRLRQKDGAYKWFADRVAPAPAAEAADITNIRGWLGTLVDVDAKKRAEEALGGAAAQAEASEDRYRLLAEAIPQQVWTAQPDGALDYVNQRCLDYFGRTMEEMLGWGWKDVLHPDDVPVCMERWGHSLRTGECYEIEFRLRRAADGAYRWHLGRALPLRDRQGNIIRWLGTSTDIDEHKRSEAEIRELNATLEQRVQERTAELCRSNQDLQQFAYVASHDLQEPLRMVSSYTQLLARRYKGRLDADADEFIHYAVDGVTRMQRLINDLLLYSRVGTRSASLGRVETAQVVEQALTNLRAAITESGAEIHTTGPLPAVNGDASQLVQVFQNLIGNAIKFRSAEPPRIHITATRQGDGTWCFSVRDNGIGIDPQFGERIFVIFQRLHSREEYPGTGIGLAICKKIIERHGGRMWLESQSHPGSTFCFTLPAQAESPACTETPDKA